MLAPEFQEEAMAKPIRTRNQYHTLNPTPPLFIRDIEPEVAAWIEEKRKTQYGGYLRTKSETVRNILRAAFEAEKKTEGSKGKARKK